MKDDKQTRPPLPQGIIDLERVRRARQAREDFEDDAVLIPFKTEPVLPFPVEIYPESLQRFVLEGAASLDCPPDFFALPMLTVAGMLVGASTAIRPKADWVEYARIWTIVVGRPGTTKTPSVEKVMAPLHAIQDDFAERYRFALADYEEEMARWAEEKKKGSMPKPPVMEQLYTTNATMEALAEVLERTPRGILLYQEEISGWVLSLNQYKGGRGSDKQQALSLWSGTPILINRKGRQVYIPRPFVGIMGGIQPHILSQMRNELSEDDGFVHRFLIAAPDDDLGDVSEAVLSETAMADWSAVCRALQNLPYDGRNPQEVRFTAKGYEAWMEWRRAHRAEQKQEDFPYRLLGPWAKLDIYALRLALVIHMLRYACGEVENDKEADEETMRRVVLLMDYLKSHARRVYSVLEETPEDKRVRLALEWMKRRGGEATSRDIQMYRVAGVKSASEAKELLRRLADRGHVVLDMQGKTMVAKLVESAEKG
ncbi:MAG TPA: DUF3987 domain-containing protein [Alicyclobacillus sp.]|nr:DUF3987 domain-containing protein [Alicyclobacillus sp.]